jgi:SAM-dependent methyltransferase
MIAARFARFITLPPQRRAVKPYSAFAALYDALIGDRFFPQLQRAFEQIVRAHSIRFQSAADVACGTGTFVRYLCKRGITPVFGVDLSPRMIHAAIAKNRCNPARFLVQDMRRLNLPQPVDLISCNFDSMNYLLDLSSLQHTLEQFAENLRPQGSIVFDMITRNQPWQGSAPLIEKRQLGNLSFFRSMRLDTQTGLQRSIVLITSPAGTTSETHLQRVYPIPSIVRALSRAGLHPTDVLDFKRLEPATRSSQRIIVMATLR